MKRWAFTCALALAGCFSGCASTVSRLDRVDAPWRTPSPQLTLEQAREFQHAALHELLAYLPEELVVDDFGGPVQQTAVLSCVWFDGAPASATNGIMLPGRAGADVAGETELQRVRERIAADYAHLGWAVEWQRGVLSNDLVLRSPDGYRFYLSLYGVETGRLRFSISSFSPCFEAPPDFDPFELR